jgi:N-acetylglutamate synthase-like GNAT family acetyltransferase
VTAAHTAMDRIKIQFLDIASTSPETIKGLVDLLNTVYLRSEESMWRKGWTRTNVEDFTKEIAAGRIIAAFQDDVIVGTVRLEIRSPELAEFGMLAVSPDIKGTGVGRLLMQYVEADLRKKGVSAIQLEVLVPEEAEYPKTAAQKKFLLDWYQRMGYQFVRDDIGELDPRLLPLLLAKCEYVVYVKNL